MIRRARIGALAALAAAIAAAPAFPSGIEAQEGGRYRVLVPDFRPEGNENRGFGEDVAEKVAELIDAYDTHQPVPKREYEQALRSNDLKKENIDCISARQLASLMNANLVVCGNFSQAGEEMTVQATVWSVGSQESFEIASFTVPRRDGDELAAERFNEDFGRILQQQRMAGLCLTFYESQQWESALTNCNQAIEISPNSTGARMVRGMVHREEGRLADALADFEAVLERDPFNQSALENAAYVAGQAGESEKSRQYYSEFLELDPDNHQVRMRIAFEMAGDLGDPAGAAALLKEGLDRAPDNVDLLERYGAAAFAAGSSLGAMDQELSPEAREYFQEALTSFEQVFEIKGAETDANLLANSIRAYVSLGQPEQGVAFGERIIQTKGDDAGVREALATAYQRVENYPAAVAQLNEAKRINPDLPNVAVRQGQILISAGNFDEGFPYLAEAVERGEQTAEAMAQFVWGQAYNTGIRGEANLGQAINWIEQAKTLPVQDPVMRSQLDFWHGYAIFRQAAAAANEQSLPVAQRTLPMFQRALELFRAGGAYAQSPAGQPIRNNYQQYLQNAQEFIEIQELIIRRGR